MAARHPALQAAARLRQALEQSAAALGEGRLDILLGGEAALQDAAILSPALRVRTGSGPSALPPLTPADKHHLREELEAARRALVRCRHLGANLNTFVRISLDAHGRAAGYDPQRTAAAALGGRDLNMRA
jgi:hypothetical protein